VNETYRFGINPEVRPDDRRPYHSPHLEETIKKSRQGVGILGELKEEGNAPGGKTKEKQQRSGDKLIKKKMRGWKGLGQTPPARRVRGGKKENEPRKRHDRREGRKIRNRESHQREGCVNLEGGPSGERHMARGVQGQHWSTTHGV